MKKNIYRENLKKAWEITKKNKLLWIFGLFAALLGNGGEFQILAKIFEGVSNSQGGASQVVSFSPRASGTGQFFLNNPMEFFLALFAVLAILFLIGFFIWVAVASQTALINGINRRLLNLEINFEEGLGTGNKKFNSVLGINIILKFAIYVIIFLIGMPLISMILKSNSSATIILCPLIFIILIPLAVTISFIAKYALAFVVLKDKDFFDALRSAFKLFLKNWVISLEMAFILFSINFLVGLLTILCLILVSTPLLAISFIYSIIGLPLFGLAMIFLVMAVDLVILCFVGAFLATYQWTTWIILFKQLTSKETVLSKIERITRKLPKWVKGYLRV